MSHPAELTVTGKSLTPVDGERSRGDALTEPVMSDLEKNPSADAGKSGGSALLSLARRGDRTAFDQLVEPNRAEIRQHCYRMLGSFHDAQDLVQETLLRAWSGVGRFEGRASVRNWLYRIATNVCLNALASRARRRRVLPESLGPSTPAMPDGEPSREIAWLEPFPDIWMEGVADTAPGPNVRYERKDTVRLAFVAAIQHLPPRQRAVLLLRDVLGWTATESARTLHLSVASANSILQRARATLGKVFPDQRSTAEVLPDAQQRTLIERYVEAWEGSDLDAFIALLQEDATLAMPPWTQWYQGSIAMRTFLAWAFDWAWKDRVRQTFRVVPTSANGQPAFALYLRGRGELEYHAHALQLATFRDGRISALTFFLMPDLLRHFQLATALPLRAVGK